MVISVPGNFYVFKTDKHPSRKDLVEFFENLGENDILEVQVNSPGEDTQIYHVTKESLDHQSPFSDLSIHLGGNLFQITAQALPYEIPFPVKDSAGNCVNIIKKIWTYYTHYYRYDGEIDMSFLNRYDQIALTGLNEYSVELYSKALPLWTGHDVFLIGQEWEHYIHLLPTLPAHMNVTILGQTEELSSRPASENAILYVIEKIPENEGLRRYELNILCYDEVMTLTFMFSYVIHPGKLNPGKRFFLIDGFFRIEGIFGIWSKVFAAARYALAKGYIPVFEIVTSDDNIYSDHEGDDIWNKFFLQPEGLSLQEVHQSCYLALSPNMNVLPIMRHIMSEVTKNIQISWPNGIFNQQIQQYIRSRQQKFLPHPERTLGVLLRGTDYIHNPLPNHPRHATIEMVMDKIDEVADSWGFDYIYLATEDEAICNKMKERYGEKITFTDQERYTVKPGQLLVELHQAKSEGNGFRLGAEYLCSINLLSQCSCLIGSGSCGGLSEALRENQGQYEHVFVFHS